jgi:hypothetical protein
MFAVSPWYGFHYDSAPYAINPAQCIKEEDRNTPEWDEFELPGRLQVISRPSVTATGADRSAMGSGDDLDKERQFTIEIYQLLVSVNKRLELLYPIQNSL